MRDEEKRAICNCCGKELVQEEYVKIEQRWGYFSNKDGILQRGKICEECFDRIIEQFRVPLEEEMVTELL